MPAESLGGRPRQRPRLLRWALGCAAVTPALALCLFDPVHFTRFGPPKLALAWLGIGLGLALVLREAGRAGRPGRKEALGQWNVLIGEVNI